MKVPVLVLLAACSPISDLFAQSGIRAVLVDFEVVDNNWMQTYGVGYDRDLNDRLSLGIQGKFGEDLWQADYRTAFHFSDNDRTSYYFGPQVGVRSYRYGGDTQMPVGVRTGVRGGLKGFYADLFMNGAYVIGAGVDTYHGTLYNGIPYSFSSGMPPWSFGIGLHLGVGWDRRD